jgi:acyl dehydratase
VKVFAGLEDLETAVGTHLGLSRWHTVTQAQIDGFARATGDQQWIHVDEAKAADGPFGCTIAHGYLTLSLVSLMTSEIYTVEGVGMRINYGLEKVRFPAPTPVGSRLQAGAELLELVATPAGSRALVTVTVNREGSDKPVCVADTVTLIVP